MVAAFDSYCGSALRATGRVVRIAIPRGRAVARALYAVRAVAYVGTDGRVTGACAARQVALAGDRAVQGLARIVARAGDHARRAGVARDRRACAVAHAVD